MYMLHAVRIAAPLACQRSEITAQPDKNMAKGSYSSKAKVYTAIPSTYVQWSQVKLVKRRHDL